jgi:hypothetical protein
MRDLGGEGGEHLTIVQEFRVSHQSPAQASCPDVCDGVVLLADAVPTP